MHSHGLAPPLYARFKNGLVYGFIPGRSVEYQELSDPLLMKGIARMLAQWHTVLDSSSIRMLMDEQSTTTSKESYAVNDIWQLCEKWINNLPTDTPDQLSRRDVLADELQWVKNEIECKGGPTVIAHCDLLSGNVVVPLDWTSGAKSSGMVPPVTFIDYEYALPSPRAFDLANHFMEWQGFECDISRIPEVGGPIMRLWVREYLEGVKSFSKAVYTNGHSKDSRVSQHKTDTGAAVMEKDIDNTVSEVSAWWGMPGFYW